MVSMGFIDPERYLGGRFKLHPALARQSLERDLTGRFGWSVEEAAAAMHDLVVMNMATAVHEVSVAKGYDPRDFVFLAYGGTLPLFAVQIAQQLGMSEVVVPQNSSVFSALGLLSADFVMRYDQTVAWDLSRADQVQRVNEAAQRMVEQARAAMSEEGFSDGDIEISRSADFRFLGQSYELTMALPNRPLTAEDAPHLAEEFFALYERTYGEGTAWKGVPEQLLNYTVTVTGRTRRPDLEQALADPRSPDDVKVATRRVFLPSSRSYQEIPVYDDTRFSAGTRVSGPAIIDATDTTIFAPPGTNISRDDHMNYVLTTNGGAR
jgi:N-methylhydantoinase A